MVAEPATSADPNVFTLAERRAIASLERLARKWPHTLTLVSAAGTLLVTKSTDHPGEGLLASRVHAVYGIPNDGGEPDVR